MKDGRWRVVVRVLGKEANQGFRVDHWLSDELSAMGLRGFNRFAPEASKA